MNLELTAGNVLGALGVGLVCISFAMKSMLWLRALALAGNVCFIIYGYVESQLPSLAVNAVLLPLNIRGLWEINHLSKAIARATHDTPVSQWLLPHMRRRAFKAGEVLFRKGEVADRLIYIASGQVRLVEIDQTAGAGELIGEVGLFSPDRKRTQSIVCDTDGELYHMTDEMIFQLYYKNPKLGFYLMRRVTERLLNDLRRREGHPAPA
jgi:hypothetical protein